MFRRKVFAVLMVLCMVMVFMPITAQAACSHKYTTEKVAVRATPDKDGKINVVCDKCGEVVKTKKITRPDKIKLSYSGATYDGKYHKPTITLYNANGNIIGSSHYTLSFSKGWKSIGPHPITVTLKGKYKGSFKATYTIRPKTPEAVGWSPDEDGEYMTLYWNPLDDESKIAGYEIQWADNPEFKDANVWLEPYGSCSLGWKRMGMHDGVTYYGRVRAVSMVNDEYQYSLWSKTKSALYTGEYQADYLRGVNYLSKNKEDNEPKTYPTGQHIKCPDCGGSGRALVTVPGSTVGTWIQVSGYCGTCGGDGYID